MNLDILGVRLLTEEPSRGLPGRQRPEGGAETGDASLPPFSECLFHELCFRGRVYSPKRPLPRFLLGTRDFNKVTVQREVVSD